MPCPADIQFPNLTELNLIENSISCFDDVSELATMFINLHTLVLSDNPVISFGDNQQVSNCFLFLPTGSFNKLFSVRFCEQ